MKEGKDITDKLRNGLTPEEAIQRLEQAIPYEPAQSEEMHPAGKPAPSPDNTTGACAKAMEFLRTELMSGGRPARELQNKAAEAGISRSTLRRARERLGIRPRKEGKPGEAGRWVWELRWPRR